MTKMIVFRYFGPFCMIFSHLACEVFEHISASLAFIWEHAKFLLEEGKLEGPNFIPSKLLPYHLSISQQYIIYKVGTYLSNYPRNNSFLVGFGNIYN